MICLQPASDWHLINAVFIFDDRWSGFYTISNPVNQCSCSIVHDFLWFKKSSAWLHGNDDICCSRVHLWNAFSPAWTTGTFVTAKGNHEAVGLPDVGTAFGSMPLRAGCHGSTIIRYCKLWQNLLRFSAEKYGGQYPDVFSEDSSSSLLYAPSVIMATVSSDSNTAAFICFLRLLFNSCKRSWYSLVFAYSSLHRERRDDALSMTFWMRSPWGVSRS